MESSMDEYGQLLEDNTTRNSPFLIYAMFWLMILLMQFVIAQSCNPFYDSCSEYESGQKQCDTYNSATVSMQVSQRFYNLPFDPYQHTISISANTSFTFGTVYLKNDTGNWTFLQTLRNSLILKLLLLYILGSTR